MYLVLHTHPFLFAARREGATWFESRVVVVTIPDSATFHENCSLLTNRTAKGDFCSLSQEVIFPRGVVTREVTVQLIDDQIAEGEESFHVQLVEGEGLVNAILHRNASATFTIIDSEDCKFTLQCIIWYYTLSLTR